LLSMIEMETVCDELFGWTAEEGQDGGEFGPDAQRTGHQRGGIASERRAQPVQIIHLEKAIEGYQVIRHILPPEQIVESL